MLNSEDDLRITIPDDAVINFNTGRIRVQHHQNKTHSPLPKGCHDDEEKIPMQDMSCTLPQEESEKALEAAQDFHNGRSSDEYVPDPTPGEKQSNGGGAFDEYFIPVNTHKKYLRGEKLYLTKDSKQLCQNWRRVIVCGLIAIVIAVAVLVGVLAATGILLAESETKNARHETSHSLEGIATISLAGHHVPPRPPKEPQREPPATSTVPESTTSFSQSVPDVTSIVPVVQPNVSQSHTVVPNSLLGEFRIVNEIFTPDLNDSTSDGYLSVATHLENELSRMFAESGGDFEELKILSFRPGSIVVQFVVKWKDEKGTILAKTSDEIMQQYLKKHNNSILAYHVEVGSVRFTDVVDECRVQNGGCSHRCGWNYGNMTRNCFCGEGMKLMPNGKTCIQKATTTEKVTTTSNEPMKPVFETTTETSSVLPEVTTVTTTVAPVYTEEDATSSTVVVPHETTVVSKTETPTTLAASVSSETDTTPNEELSTTAATTTTAEQNLPVTLTQQTTTTTPTTATSPATESEEVTTTFQTTTAEMASTTSERITTEVDVTTPPNNNVSATENTTIVEDLTTIPQVPGIMKNITSEDVPTTTESTTGPPLPFVTIDFKEYGDTTTPGQTGTSSATSEINTMMEGFTTTTTYQDLTSTATTLTSEEALTTTQVETTDTPMTTTENKILIALPEVVLVYNETTTNPTNPPTETTIADLSSTATTFLPEVTVMTTPEEVTTENVEKTATYSSSETNTEVVTNMTTMTSNSTTSVEANVVNGTMENVLTTMPYVDAGTTKTLLETTTVVPTSTVGDQPTETPLLSNTTSNFTNSGVNRTTGIRLVNNDTDFTPTMMDVVTNETEAYTDVTDVTVAVDITSEMTSAPINSTEPTIVDGVDTIPTAPDNLTTTTSLDGTTNSPIVLVVTPETFDNSTATTPMDTNTTTSESSTTNFLTPVNGTETPSTTPLSGTLPDSGVEFTIPMTDATSGQPTVTEAENRTEVPLVVGVMDNVTVTYTMNTTATSVDESTAELNSTESVDATVPDIDGNSTVPDIDGNSTASNSSAFDDFSTLTTNDDYDLYNSTLNDTVSDVTEGIACRDDQFLCSSLNVCLNNTFLCDGIQDCPDGLDEGECAESCNLNFRCSNSSMCIMSEAHCDGIWDCEDGSDEQDCTPTECAKHEVMCLDGSTCIKPGHICDWKYNCRDRSDEVGCVERTTCESGNRFFCNDGLCIPWSLKCDGDYDCKDKEDEENCTCKGDDFRCNDGKCLKSSSRCDGHRDCLNAEDEMGCVKVDEKGMVIAFEPYSGSWSLVCAEDWTLDDGHYLCQELGFGHALSADQNHVMFNGSWMAMKRDNLTTTALWTERIAYSESCNSNLAATVDCQTFDCGNYSGLLHRRRKRQSTSLSPPTTQWPFIAYVSMLQSTKGCLSEILTPVWLITSAECLLSIGKELQNGSDWIVRTNVARGFDTELAQNHEVLKITPHHHSSKFRSLVLRDYDVALIRLKHALVFSERTGAICLPEEQVPYGITCFSGVLGTDKPRAPPPQSPTISSLALMVLDREACNVPNHYNSQISNRMLCTKSSDTTSVCDNDEGTPLMCLSGPNKWYLAGMLTYQRLCGVYSWHPAVFSNLFSMKGFIDQVIGHRQYKVHYDDSLYVITPPTTTGPPETTTSSEAAMTTVSEDLIYAIHLHDQYSSVNESSGQEENATTSSENLFTNETEETRMVNTTDVDELLDIEVTGNKTVFITTTLANVTFEEKHTVTPELISVNNTPEFMALKQPRVDESITEWPDNFTLDPNLSETTAPNTESTVTTMEDFIVDTVHSNNSEHNAGYLYATDASTEAYTTTEPNVTVTSIVGIEHSTPSNESTTVSPHNHTVSENVTSILQTTLSPETTESSNNTSLAETTTGVETTSELMPTEADMLVKEYVVKSRNINVPLEFHVTNGSVVVSEGQSVTELGSGTTTTTEASATTELPATVPLGTSTHSTKQEATRPAGDEKLGVSTDVVSLQTTTINAIEDSTTEAITTASLESNETVVATTFSTNNGTTSTNRSSTEETSTVTAN